MFLMTLIQTVLISETSQISVRVQEK